MDETARSLPVHAAPASVKLGTADPAVALRAQVEQLRIAAQAVADEADGTLAAIEANLGLPHDCSHVNLRERAMALRVALQSSGTEAEYDAAMHRSDMALRALDVAEAGFAHARATTIAGAIERLRYAAEVGAPKGQLELFPWQLALQGALADLERLAGDQSGE